ncbi:hypothetical protein JKP88DRAFT_327396 [Tribonema minus]|uniref:Uncharacterized protein n=1 Tax=Tribonema minus TaxID=303371 RepID=A0A836CAI4_9STRA|nr:hypothetical protein JKP88DRAFT_327396 [Tribonema minus]
MPPRWFQIASYVAMLFAAVAAAAMESEALTVGPSAAPSQAPTSAPAAAAAASSELIVPVPGVIAATDFAFYTLPNGIGFDWPSISTQIVFVATPVWRWRGITSPCAGLYYAKVRQDGMYKVMYRGGILSVRQRKSFVRPPCSSDAMLASQWQQQHCTTFCSVCDAISRLSGTTSKGPAALSMFLNLVPVAQKPDDFVEVTDATTARCMDPKQGVAPLHIEDFKPAREQAIQLHSGGAVALPAGYVELMICFTSLPVGLVFDSVEFTAA